jgi:cytochrome c-type biogenesis protein CcsB
MFVLKKIYPNASMKMLSSSIKSTSGLPDMLRIKVSNQDDSKIVEIQGTKATIGDTKELIINGIKVSLTYGSKIIPIPFDIKLVDFELQRYPGSNTPSSYASDVILIDKEQNINKPYRIFMNHILEHRGYRFFQSSYDMDEKGTILSVNHDPGTLPTYIGYFLLTLGMFWTLFSTKSRFQQLLRGTRKLQQGALSILAILIFSLTPSYSSDELNHIDNFSKLVIQDNQGRMKPLDTLTSQVIAKITRKSSFLGMNANQLFLRMMIQPEKYQDKAMIKIGHPKIAKALNMPIDTKYLKFSDFFEKEGNGYILYNEVSNATRKKPAQRDQYDKELIKVDERVNISYMVYTGSLFKIFPKPHDTNNLWLSPIDAIQNLPEKDSKMAQMIIFNYFDAVGKAIDSDNWTQAEKALDIIKQYQNKFGSEVLPTDSQINLEVIYNHLGIFGKLIPLYLIVGLILLILSFIHILKRSFNLKLYTQIVLSIIILGFAVHTIGLGVRWYISGHAPWSNAYESIVYIAWATLLAGFLFMKNSPITLASTAILSGVLLFVAHLNWLDPQITTLMPVLKSYWLMIHVAVITASYGFLGLGALLAFVTFTLYILKTESNQENINKSIKELSKINEMSLIIGLILLTIGNFLGGVWANESWGRYWGWDSKETWAAVTILIYSVVIHLRFIPKLNSIFIYNIASLVAYSSVLMTYFGVNFYLSGLHSYAAGDPLPVPSWVLPSIFVIFAIITLAYLRDKAIKKN